MQSVSAIFGSDIAAQTHEDGPQRENREANSVQPVWKNLAKKDRLIQHEKSHRLNSEEQKTYSCYICKYKMNSKAYFNDHNKKNA